MEKNGDSAMDRRGISEAVVSIKDVCVMLGLSRAKVNRMKKAGKLPKAMKIGRLIKWPRSAIDAWINNGCMTDDELKKRKIEEARRKFAENKDGQV